MAHSIQIHETATNTYVEYVYLFHSSIGMTLEMRTRNKIAIREIVERDHVEVTIVSVFTTLIRYVILSYAERKGNDSNHWQLPLIFVSRHEFGFETIIYRCIINASNITRSNDRSMDEIYNFRRRYHCRFTDWF